MFTNAAPSTRLATHTAYLQTVLTVIHDVFESEPFIKIINTALSIKPWCSVDNGAGNI